MGKRRITIFGATGSIGQSTLDLIRRNRAAYDVVALTGGHNIDQLTADAIEFDAEIAVTAYDEHLDTLKQALGHTKIKVAAGHTALLDAASEPADWIMSAIVGSAGLASGMEALKQGTTLALANKESLVCAGPLLLETAKQHGARILPVDSEHSATFQALVGEDISTVEKITITGSGGPFRDWPVGDMARATLQEALNHPNWAMGQRITIDSATMFNKALELIETKEYFGISAASIEAIIHPESRVHALVQFNDGALMAHLGPPDMRHAIGYALNWPNRSNLPVDRLDLAKLGQLRFEAPDETRFPALRMARDVMNTGGLAGSIFNAAKEAALDAFIEGRAGFMDMAKVVEQVLTQMSSEQGLIDAAITLDNVTKTDHLARIRADEAIRRL